MDLQLQNLVGQNKVAAISNEIQKEERDKGNTEFSGGDASEEVLRKIPEKVGCTACIALVTKDKMYIANVGDSRCVLTEGNNTHDLSDDHKPDNEEESKRITEAGGFVSNDGRVNGELSLSRAIGDTYYKQNKNLTVEKQCITCIPQITVR